MVLELGFIALAATCLFAEIHLPNSLITRSAATKSAVTILSITWQVAALFPIVGLSLHLFSSEWSFLFHQTSLLKPGKTDKFSVMTSSLLEQGYHAFFDSVCSMSFRAAFIVTLASIALHHLAPGTIGVNTYSRNIPVTVAIGNISAAQHSQFTGDSDDSVDVPYGAPMPLAITIIRLEMSSNYTYGFTTSPSNCAVGWPDQEYLQNQTILSYPSDAICWSHQCHWEAPIWLDSGASAAPSMPNITWDFAWADVDSDFSILDTLGENRLTSSMSAFMLCNSSSGAVGGNNGFNMSNLRSSTTNNTECSMLLCDPNLSFFSGTAELLSDGTITVSHLVTSSTETAIGNIDVNASIAMFSASNGALDELWVEPAGNGYLNVFPNSYLFSSQSSDSGLANLEPPDVIGANIDNVYTTITKAFSSGYVNATSTITVSVPATTVVNDRLVLTASKDLWIVTIVLVGIAFVASLLVAWMHKSDRRPFTLENIARVVKELDSRAEVDELIGPVTRDSCLETCAGDWASHGGIRIRLPKSMSARGPSVSLLLIFQGSRATIMQALRRLIVQEGRIGS